MADTDDVSAASAREAGDAKGVVRRDLAALTPLLAPSGYAPEAAILKTFGERFAEYRSLDDEILMLAVENTNLKARRLSFGRGREEAEGLRRSLDVVAKSAGPDAWRVRALAAEAMASVRDVQALQGPHIAEADDATMTRLEAQMTASLDQAQQALAALAPAAGRASRPNVAAAEAALTRVADLNAEIVALSRRNTNVRSLAASLGRKRTLTVACDEQLQALQQALEHRGYPGVR
jgi:hypothetical protein